MFLVGVGSSGFQRALSWFNLTVKPLNMFYLSGVDLAGIIKSTDDMHFTDSFIA